jgi:glycosyltransferase involved in cell wall biosynthesis
VQKELAPYVPPYLEWMLAAARTAIVYDIDDAIYLPYTRSRNPLVRLALAGKIPAALRMSAVVLAGNAFLAEYASRYNRRTIHVPTVIDPAKYAAAREDPGSGPGAGARSAGGPGSAPPVVGWIGSSETVRYLGEKAAVLRSVARVSPFELRVIGAEAPAIPDVRTVSVPWSEESEARELSRCDVGIMPLPDDDWARGKCGLKLLQYMATGLPVVSSPAGGADGIVRHGTNGYVATTDAEWRLHLAALVDNAALRAVMGREGRRRVEERFSLGLWAPRMGEIVTRVVRGQSLEGLAW